VVILEEVLAAIDRKKARILLFAESSLPATQYQAFRKLVLDELGNSGLVGDLKRLYTESKGR
jgi:hypothetical protein